MENRVELGELVGPSPRRAEILEAVRGAALAITSELSLEELLQKLADQARRLVAARYAAIGVSSPGGQTLERFIVSGMGAEEIAAIGRWPRGRGLLGSLLKARRPIRLNEIPQDPRSTGYPPNHPHMRSFLGVPIIAQGRVLGSFYLTDKQGETGFSSDDEDLLVLFAAHAALSIQNAQLFGVTDTELRQRKEQLRRADERARFLVELAAMLPGRPVNEGVPVDRLVERISQVIGDACVINLFDQGRTSLIRQRYAAHPSPERGEAAQAVMDALWPLIGEQVIDQRTAIFVPDVAHSLPCPQADALRAHRFTGLIVFPLETERRVQGILAALCSYPDRFAFDDYEFARVVADRLATSLENVELLEELDSAIRMREEFVSVAVHELRTPVSVLRNSAEILKTLPDLSPERRQQVVDAIGRNSDRLAALTSELLDEFRIQAGHLAFHYETLDLIELVEQVIGRLEVRHGSAPVQIATELSTATGKWDRSRLDQVLTNLIDNAIKYSEPGTPVLVTVWRTGNEYHLTVADHGIGIPEESREMVFSAFYRAPNARRAHSGGTGLGLHLTTEIIARLGGRLWYEPNVPCGTTFHLVLPVDGSERQKESPKRRSSGEVPGLLPR